MIVLDTHAWLWWAGDPRLLSPRARARIGEADSIGVPSISCWEAAMLVQKGRLQFDRDLLDWMRQALALPRVSLLSLTPEIAVTAAALSGKFPGDPADRIIVATAMNHGAPLITRDQRIRQAGQLETIW